MTTTAREIVVHASQIAVLDAGGPPAPAEAIRQEIKGLAREMNSKFLRLGQLLRTVQRDRLYAGWGFDSFEAWAEVDSGLHYETARIFAAMERSLVEQAKISREVLADIGWTKAKNLVPLQNAGKLAPRMAEVIEKAKTLPASQFQDYVAQVRGSIPATPGTPVQPDRIPVNFMLAPDQQKVVIDARRLAEQLTGSIDPGVQFTAICQDFMSSITPDEAKAPDAWRARRASMLLDVLGSHFGLVVEVRGARTLEGQAIYERLTQQQTQQPAPVATATVVKQAAAPVF